MISPLQKRLVVRIVPFSVFFVVAALIYLVLEKGILGDLSYYPSTKNPYDFKNSIWITVISATIFGLVIGSFEVLFFSKFFVSKSFIKKILYKITSYLMIVIFFVLTTSLVSFIVCVTERAIT